jgi:hypothetical protein
MSTTARKLSSASWLDLYNCQSYHKIVLNSDIYRIVESNQLERFGKKGETTSGIDFSLSRRVGSGPSLFLLLGE